MSDVNARFLKQKRCFLFSIRFFSLFYDVISILLPMIVISVSIV